jgi:uncharacterized protein
MKYKYTSIDEKEILDIYKSDPNFNSWFKIVKKILHSTEFQKRRLFKHHEYESVWTHCIKVSFESYKFAKKYGYNEYNCAIAGLLHDFYTKAWQDSIELTNLDDKYRENFINPKRKKLLQKHGFTHPLEALENSRIYFKKYLNKDIENAIVTHMFPLSLFTKYKLPNNKTSYVITYIDKKVSMNVISSVKGILKYSGVTKKELN